MFIRAFVNLFDRVGGPMTFRIILQPLMATLLAVRGGIKDAQEGRPAYFWTILTDADQRADLLRQGWKAVGRVFILAVIMDAIYQVVVLHWFYPMELLVVAIVLAVIPYLLIRGPVNRLVRRFRRSPQASTKVSTD